MKLEALPKRLALLDEDAFREFAAHFGPRFRTFFRRRGLPMAEAEELAVSCVTDIAMRVEKHYDERGGRFEAWVFTLARHALSDWWRRRRPTTSLENGMSVPGPDYDAEPTPEVADAVREAVAKLSEKDQRILRLRELGDQQTYSYIGTELGIQPATARVRHHRALQRLRSLLETDPRIVRLLERNVHRGEKHHEPTSQYRPQV